MWPSKWWPLGLALHVVKKRDSIPPLYFLLTNVFFFSNFILILYIGTFSVQYEMIGNSVMEFIHPDDHKELAKQFVVQVPGRVSVKGLGMEKTKDIPTPMTVNFFDDSGRFFGVKIQICLF